MVNKIKYIRERINDLYDKYFGVEDYQKFVVITRSRTGSNLLISLLNSKALNVNHFFDSSPRSWVIDVANIAIFDTASSLFSGNTAKQ